MIQNEEDASNESVFKLVHIVWTFHLKQGSVSKIEGRVDFTDVYTPREMNVFSENVIDENRD